MRIAAHRLLQVRQAAEVHRQVRSYVQTIAKPGILMSELCEKLEDSGERPVADIWVDAGLCCARTSGCCLAGSAAALALPGAPPLLPPGTLAPLAWHRYADPADLRRPPCCSPVWLTPDPAQCAS